jgi:pimeloyl-ACP methyl ester carboxylesterase
MVRRAAIPLAFSLASCASTPPQAPPRTPPPPGLASPTIALSPCTIPDLKRPAKCGTAHVLEDRTRPGGRVVALKIVVVPAEHSPPLPDPVVFIAGGPGGAATDAAAIILEGYGRASSTRDFVFVDQRGMGEGSPLRCKLFEGTDLGTLAGGELPESRLRACLASMDADPSLYTTDVAADDLAEVLAALGYEKVNVVAESYGSFAAQALAHAHPARVRSLALNGVASPVGDFALRFAESSEAVLEQLFAECAANPACRARHPDPAAELQKAFARLREHPAQVSATADDGNTYTATLDVNAFALTLRGSLYGARSRGGTLGMIHDVAEGGFDGIAPRVVLFPLMLATESSIGAYLSIACAESLAGVGEEEAKRATAKTFVGMARVGPLLRACAFWPKRPSPAWLHQPVTGNLPALLVNGTMDPATPLSGFELAGSQLTNAQRVIVRGEGHSAVTPCLDGIVAAFFDDPFAKVDATCVKAVATEFDASERR